MIQLTCGAINSNTGKFTIPIHALKGPLYKCPECFQEVILRKGNKNIHHFAHHSSNGKTCTHNKSFSKGEGPDHYNAKYILKEKLENQSNILIIRNCISCNTNKLNFKISYNTKFKIVIEKHIKIEEKNKILDIAFINDNEEIIYGFEILNTHKTNECDREGLIWFEILAEEVIQSECKLDNKLHNYTCRRNYICNKCTEAADLKAKEYEFFIQEMNKKRLEKQEELKILQEQQELKRLQEKEELKILQEQQELIRLLEYKQKREQIDLLNKESLQKYEKYKEQRRLQHQLFYEKRLKEQKELEEYEKIKKQEYKIKTENECFKRNKLMLISQLNYLEKNRILKEERLLKEKEERLKKINEEIKDNMFNTLKQLIKYFRIKIRNEKNIQLRLEKERVSTIKKITKQSFKKMSPEERNNYLLDRVKQTTLSHMIK
jgi:hypothetical protein